ncbi:hypothetical protein D3C77_548440 [compost metagenome]
MAVILAPSHDEAVCARGDQAALRQQQGSRIPDKQLVGPLIARLGEQAALLVQGHAEATVGHQGGRGHRCGPGGSPQQQVLWSRRQDTTAEQQCHQGKQSDMKGHEVRRPVSEWVVSIHYSRGSRPSITNPWRTGACRNVSRGDKDIDTQKSKNPAEAGFS